MSKTTAFDADEEGEHVDDIIFGGSSHSEILVVLVFFYKMHYTFLFEKKCSNIMVLL
jgi:hypothetical protein